LLVIFLKNFIDVTIKFLMIIELLIQTDKKFTLFEFTVQWMINKLLTEKENISGKISFFSYAQVASEIYILLNALAWAGNTGDFENAKKAFEATDAGEFPKAEWYWTDLIKLYPDNAAGWSNRGNSKMSQNRPQEALADYNKSVELAPNFPDPYLNRGAALEALGQWDEAIADYNRVLEINPQDAAAYNNRGNAVASGSQFTGWTGTNSKLAATSGATWSITFTNTVTWASADAARYFFNAGGRIKIDVSKTATGQTGDPEWNDLANTLCGDIFITGGTATQTIAGTAYTGTTKIGGTGSPNTLATTTGWYDLTAGAAATIVYKQFADTAPYTSNFIQHSIARNAGSTTLTITTLWSAVDGDPISGGTAASGATPGTAPCTIVTYFPPSSTFLSTASWGTPTVAATTA
jgi:Flp pilus assembly protein TadD